MRCAFIMFTCSGSSSVFSCRCTCSVVCVKIKIKNGDPRSRVQGPGSSSKPQGCVIHCVAVTLVSCFLGSIGGLGRAGHCNSGKGKAGRDRAGQSREGTSR